MPASGLVSTAATPPAGPRCVKVAARGPSTTGLERRSPVLTIPFFAHAIRSSSCMGWASLLPGLGLLHTGMVLYERGARQYTVFSAGHLQGQQTYSAPAARHPTRSLLPEGIQNTKAVPLSEPSPELALPAHVLSPRTGRTVPPRSLAEADAWS